MDARNLTTKSKLLDLPNEVLIQILDQFSLQLLAPLVRVCLRFHDLALRLIRARCTLPKLPKDHVIIFECYHPSACSVEPHLLCQYLGTPGTHVTATPGSLSTSISSSPGHDDGSGKAGGGRARSEYGKLTGLYSRFRPMRRKVGGPASSSATGLVDAAVPSSREDLPSSGDPERSMESASFLEPLASQPINLDAEEPFSQLCLNMCLVKLGPTVYFEGLVTLVEGHQRLKRKWLEETARLTSRKPGAGREDGEEEQEQKTRCGDAARWYGGEEEEDAQMLWCDGRRNTGIRVALRERAWRRHAPVLVRQEEPAVSYVMDHQELLIRTVHLVRAIEEAKLQMNGPSGKAMIIGTVRR